MPLHITAELRTTMARAYNASLHILLCMLQARNTSTYRCLTGSWAPPRARQAFALQFAATKHKWQFHVPRRTIVQLCRTRQKHTSNDTTSGSILITVALYQQRLRCTLFTSGYTITVYTWATKCFYPTPDQQDYWGVVLTQYIIDSIIWSYCFEHCSAGTQ